MRRKNKWESWKWKNLMRIIRTFTFTFSLRLPWNSFSRSSALLSKFFSLPSSALQAHFQLSLSHKKTRVNILLLPLLNGIPKEREWQLSEEADDKIKLWELSSSSSSFWLSSLITQLYQEVIKLIRRHLHKVLRKFQSQSFLCNLFTTFFHV